MNTEEGQPVELGSHSSNSITLGIVDATRELRADTLVLRARLAAGGLPVSGLVALSF